MFKVRTVSRLALFFLVDGGCDNCCRRGKGDAFRERSRFKAPPSLPASESLGAMGS